MHAVRARPLPAIKNNIEPDEHREEADTIPTRGVNPESPPLRAYALRYTHLSAYAASLRSVAPGSGLLFPRAGASLSRRRAQPEDGTPLPIGCRPYGLCYSPRSHEDFSCSPARANYHAPLSRKTIMRATRAIMQGAQQRAKECPIGAPPLNAVRRSSLRANARNLPHPQRYQSCSL